MDKITDAEWRAFFRLIDKMVDDPAKWERKAELLYSKSIHFGCTTNTAEFMSWGEGFGEEQP